MNYKGTRNKTQSGTKGKTISLSAKILEKRMNGID
jgi:hypothetical protein